MHSYFERIWSVLHVFHCEKQATLLVIKGLLMKQSPNLFYMLYTDSIVKKMAKETIEKAKH